LSIYQYEYLHNHGFITDGAYARIIGACTLGYRSSECVKIRNITDRAIEATNAVINNIYQPCYYQMIPTGSNKYFKQSGIRMNLKDETMSCEDDIGIETFFNDPLVHKRFHVENVAYSSCNGQIFEQYTSN
jgi:hypothetical protein